MKESVLDKLNALQTVEIRINSLCQEERMYGDGGTNVSAFITVGLVAMHDTK